MLAKPDTNDLIVEIAAEYTQELKSINRVLDRQVEYFTGMGLSPDNSTSHEDCRLLYLLIRYFDRRSVFEAGTYVGMTTVTMNKAAWRNDGRCYTCDPVDCGALPPGSGIRFLNQTADEALASLRAERIKIDFAFFDWVPDEATMRAANKMFTRDAIIAVHDYGNNDKGAASIEAINLHYKRSRRGTWYLPSQTPTIAGDGGRVNICTAFWLPDCITGTRRTLRERLMLLLKSRRYSPRA
jgi:hypothetical protein